jgi:hypothetical protein
MRGLRDILLKRRRLALWLVALTLSMKALLPGGFMLDTQSRTITIEICADSNGVHLTRQIAVPLEQGEQDRAAQHAKGAACPFSALTMAGTPGADPVLLGLALAFILAIGFVPVAVPERERPYRLRPPLRGPPLIA